VCPCDTRVVASKNRKTGPELIIGITVYQQNISCQAACGLHGVPGEAKHANGVCAHASSFRIADDALHVNAQGGAIALGHPLGMTGARLALTLVHRLQKAGGRFGLATLCVGVGQGVALAIERI
jgi:acetyl-CoA acetyltransferase